MRGEQLVDIFLHLIILMPMVNVNSQFHRAKGLSVYDIELWHRMRGSGNNSGTYHSSNVGESEDGKKYEKSSRRRYDDELSEESGIDTDESSESEFRRSRDSKRRFFYSWEDLFCDDLMDCGESEDDSEEIFPFSRPTLSTPLSLSEIRPTRPSQPRPKPQSLPTTPQLMSTSRPYSSSAPTPLPTLDTRHVPGSIPESMPSLTNDITIVPREQEHREIPNGYHRDQHSPHAYKLHTEQVCWFDARSRCEMESAELVVIENGAQYDIVLRIAKETMGDAFSRFHIGFQRQLAASPWITVYGDRLPFEKWANCLANNTLEKFNCGGFIVGPDHLDGLISYPCSQKYAYMCEFKLPSNCG